MSDQQYTANTEVEQALLHDNTGTYRDSLLTTFNTERLKIIQVLNKGVKPDEYTTLSNLLKSIEEAINIVNNMWSNFQKNQ